MDPNYKAQPGQKRNRNTCKTPGCRGTGLRALDSLCDPCYQKRLARTPVECFYGPTPEEYRAMTPEQRRQVHPDDRPDCSFRLHGVWVESDGAVHDVD